MLEGKLKKTTRRQLYKRVAGKPVSKKAQQKQSTNKIEAKNKKIVVMKGSKKKELVKKSLGKKVPYFYCGNKKLSLISLV